jgi:serine/threonine-protein kinase
MPFAPPEGTELVEIVGAGTVFEVALVRRAGQLVVAKRLVSRVRREAAGLRAVAREVGLLSRARHHVLPELIASGDDGHGPFIVESQLEGASLAAGAEFLRSGGAAVPARFYADVARRAAEALATLHGLADDGGALEVVHGDVAPDHLFRGPDGAIAFVDFGAARFRGMPEPDGDERGTLPFVAPEIARGEGQPSQAGDVYALAASILAFATGAPLTAATTDAAMLLEVGERGLRLDRLDRLDGLHAGARDALRAALAFDPAARLASAADLAARLRG